jgi:RNA-directed DNA polymerase
MSQPLAARYKWDEIDWRKLERSVFKLQKRIYQASKSGDCKRLHQLQKLLLNSKSAKALAVRRVAQVNQARKLPELTA